MYMLSFVEFKVIFDRLYSDTEIIIYLNEKRYMIIKYESYITFQRIGNIEEQSGEIKYNSLDELFNSVTIDNICLRDCWNNIDDIIIDDFVSLKEDKEEFINYRLNN